jgi:hypothetical protein
MASAAKRKALGRLREICVDLGMIENGVNCVVGPYADLPAYVAWENDEPAAANPRIWADEPRGCYEYRRGYRPIIWLPRVPRTPREIGTLAHEALHAIRPIMQDWVGIEFDRDTQEVYCHALSHVVTTILTELRRKP